MGNLAGAHCISNTSCPPQHGLYLGYSLGQSFDGLARKDAQVSCNRAPAGSGGRSSPFFTAIYGTCRPAVRFQEYGCHPPLQVQSWPACDRNSASFEGVPKTPLDATPDRTLRVEGFRVASFDGGYEYEMYLPLTTLVVFAQNTRLARDALQALPRIALPDLSSLQAQLLCNGGAPPSSTAATASTASDFSAGLGTAPTTARTASAFNAAFGFAPTTASEASVFSATAAAKPKRYVCRGRRCPDYSQYTYGHYDQCASRDHSQLLDPINVLWYSRGPRQGSESNVDANDVWDRLAEFAHMSEDDANFSPVDPIPITVPKSLADDLEYIGSAGHCKPQARTAADGNPIAAPRHHVRLFYAFSIDRGGAFVVGDAHTDECGGTSHFGDCVSCHYALPSDNYTRDKKILPAWKLQGFHTGYHYLENTAYVRQSCGAPNKHRLYVHGDGYEISLQTVPKRR